MPTTITLYHFNELTGEAREKAIIFWKENIKFNVDVYEEITNMAKKKIERFIRVSLKDLGYPNQEIRTFYNERTTLKENGHLTLRSFAIKGMIEVNIDKVEAGLYNDFLVYSDICKGFGGVKVKIILELEEADYASWDRRERFKSKVKDVSRYPVSKDTYEMERRDNFSKFLVEKLQDNLNKAIEFITNKADEELKVICNTLLVNSRETINNQLQDKIIDHAVKANLNYLEDGTVFHDEYYFNYFPESRDWS